MNSINKCLWCDTVIEDIDSHHCDQLIAARLEDGIVTCLWCNTGTEDIESHTCDQLIAIRLEEDIITCRTCFDFFDSLDEYVIHKCKKNEDEPPAKKHEDKPRAKKRHIQRKRRNKSTEDIKSHLNKQLIATRLEKGILTCRTCYNFFHTIDDYAVHRCEPPAKKRRVQRQTIHTKQKEQVGRGRRQALGGHAQQEIFEPENDSDLLLEMRQQENRIRKHLISKLNNGMKWYILIKAQFKKIVKTDDGSNYILGHRH